MSAGGGDRPPGPPAGDGGSGRDDGGETRGRVLYHRLEEVRERLPGDPPTIASAAVVTCMASGRTLDGSGGGCRALAPEVVDALDMDLNGGRARVVCDAALYDEMVEVLKGVGWAMISRDWLHLARVHDVLRKAGVDIPESDPDGVGVPRGGRRGRRRRKGGSGT